MKIGIVGLGLIGGSFAKVFNKNGHTVLAYDINDSVLSLAKSSGIIDEVLTRDKLSVCDLIIIAIYPEQTIEYVHANAKFFSANTIIMDCCGIKRIICEEIFLVADKYGFRFIGGHPMAGTENSGFNYSRIDIFKDATMVLVPQNPNDILLLDKIKDLLSPAEFSSFIITTAEQHDKIVALTSQLSHLIASAHITCSDVNEEKFFCGNSFKDMTRVANLNSKMWTELFIKNSDYLTSVLDLFIEKLVKYKNLIKDKRESELDMLLKMGNKYKEEIDNICKKLI